MAALFGFNTRSDVRDSTTTLPDQPIYLPYELRTEMNWVDFSCTANPLGTPKSFLRAMHSSLVDGELAYAPDRDARSLRAVLSRRFGLSAESFLCGTTTSDIIRAIAQTYQPCSVGVSVPISAEYLLAVSNAGHEVVELTNQHSFVVPDAFTARRDGFVFDAAVLANPTFPTSRLLSRITLINYLESCKWVIVDESLIELTLGGESMVELTEQYRNLIIVRSMTYTFAMPGIPISYCVAHPDTIAQIRCFFDSSGISMFAEVLADIALSEEEYIENTRDLLDTEIPWMQCMLNLIPGIHIFPAEANFVMCSFDKGDATDLAVSSTDELVLRLQLVGFLVRKLEGMPGITNDRYFCVAIKTREENEKLLQALRSIILSR